MSTELRVALYFDDIPPKPDALACAIATAFATWPQAGAQFSGLRVLRSNRHTTVSQTPPPLDLAEICAAARGHGGADELVSTRSSLRCWRFPGASPELGSVGVWLEAWGPEWSVRNHEDRGIGGDAALSVFDVGPFIALLDPEPTQTELNPRVEENLEALTALIFLLVQALTPRSIKVFSARCTCPPTPTCSTCATRASSSTTWRC